MHCYSRCVLDLQTSQTLAHIDQFCVAFTCPLSQYKPWQTVAENPFAVVKRVNMESVTQSVCLILNPQSNALLFVLVAWSIDLADGFIFSERGWNGVKLLTLPDIFRIFRI